MEAGERRRSPAGSAPSPAAGQRGGGGLWMSLEPTRWPPTCAACCPRRDQERRRAQRLPRLACSPRVHIQFVMTKKSAADNPESPKTNLPSFYSKTIASKCTVQYSGEGYKCLRSPGIWGVPSTHMFFLLPPRARTEVAEASFFLYVGRGDVPESRHTCIHALLLRKSGKAAHVWPRIVASIAAVPANTRNVGRRGEPI